MMRPIRAHPILIVSVMIISLLTFQVGEVSEVFALSIEDERKLGEKFLKEVRQYYDIVDDPFVNDYINALGQYLVSPNDTRPFPFRFYVIKDNTLNAFAAPGGHIFVFTGLINAMDEVDELAAVVTHELGHVTARHISDRMEQSKTINMVTLAGMLAAAFLGGKAGGALMTGAMAAGIQKQLQYSREDERQADQLGFRYMDEAGFDPSGMVRTLKKMQKNQYVGTETIPTYLLTHPGGVERMANIDNMMKGYKIKSDNPARAHFRRQFHYFKTVVQAKYGDPYVAERLFEEKLRQNSDRALAHLGLGMLMIGDAEYDRAIEHFKKANALEPDSGMILRYLGEAYLYRGRDREALNAFKRATQIDRYDRSAFYLLAMSYQNLGDYKRAIGIYEKLTSPLPIKNEVFYNLGVCHGRMSNLGPAHYYFGIYFKRKGQRDKAEFHLQKAESLSKQDPALLKKIQQAKQDPAKQSRR